MLKKFFSILCAAFLFTVCSIIVFAQTEITIKKRTSIIVPGMPDIKEIGKDVKQRMPGYDPDAVDGLENRKSTVYIKGARMRTDMFVKEPSRLTGKPEPVTYSSILQCDKQRLVQFNSKKKKYHQESLSGASSADIKNAKKGGYVTVSGSIMDTGERAKVFGYDAKHLKQTITITPGANACQKQKLQMEIEGWYADIPEFACPLKRQPSEFQMNGNCFDEVDFQMKGAITGIALKEIKKFTLEGQTVTITEEAVELLKTPIADALFEPPANYSAANTYKEVADDSLDNPVAQSASQSIQKPDNSASNSSTFAPPSAGLEKPPVVEKQAGIVRIGIVKPKITTPESKSNPDAGADIADAATKSLLESFKNATVEAIELSSDAPESECKEKLCDYIFYSTITQKRGGGGMFGKMVAMGAMTMAGAMIPGIGSMIASTVASQVMNQTMGKNAKAKDEFSFEYKVFGADNTILKQGTSKNKTDQDGQDVLSPQIKTASTAVLAEILKKK